MLIRLTPAGRFEIECSVSTPTVRTTADGLAVLQSFASPTTLEQAASRLFDDLGIQPEETIQFARRLVQQGILVRVEEGGAAQSIERTAHNFGHPEIHLRMLRDLPRVMSYRSAIVKQAPGRVVLDLGTGTGVMAMFAAQAGARQVYAIEESAISAVAREMFVANGVSERCVLLEGHSKDVELPEPVDLLVHELIGDEPLGENMLTHLHDARRRFLRPGGRMIPWKFEVCAIGIEPRSFPMPRARAVLEAQELGRLYGLDFSPLAATLGQHRQPTRAPASSGSLPGLMEKLLSTESTVCSFDFYRDDLDVQRDRYPFRLAISSDGRLGLVALFFRAHLDDQIVLSSSPFLAQTHWSWSLHELHEMRAVRQGEEVELVAHLSSVDGRQSLAIDWA